MVEEKPYFSQEHQLNETELKVIKTWVEQSCKYNYIINPADFCTV